jgi:hypothetical protein
LYVTPQYDLPDLPQRNRLRIPQGPDSGISAIIPADKFAIIPADKFAIIPADKFAIIPADKFASLRQARDAEKRFYYLKRAY